MQDLPLRLLPGQDLRQALAAAVSAAMPGTGGGAAFVLSGIGSLDRLVIRCAGQAQACAPIEGAFEIVALAGTIAANGSHLHGAVADAEGQVVGGHLGYGCRVRTTIEVLLRLLPDWDLRREPDPVTGYDELVIRAAQPR